MKAFLPLLALFSLILSACTQIQPLLDVSTTGTTSETPSSVTQVTPSLSPATLTPTVKRPTVLRVWLPPRFNPDSGEPAGELLKQRLDDFTRQHPGIQLDVRVKAPSGVGGLLDSLVTTSAAASQVMPDVVALSREDLEAAALKGILHPFPNPTDIREGPDWYDYTRQLAQIQNSVFGLPFAGDISLVVYQPDAIPVYPSDWNGFLENQLPFLFAAADPVSFFTLTLYQARGGSIQDSQGQPYLDPVPLEEVLNFYAQARNSGVLPEGLIHIEDEREAWVSFLGGAATQAFIWSSTLLSSGVEDLATAVPPTGGAAPFTLARGWVWALSSPDDERLQLGMQLADFLVESSFMAAWSQASGYLPARPSALDAWEVTPNQSVLVALSHSARLQPSEDILNILGAPLKQATLSILSGESEPATAARTAADSLIKP